MRTFFIVADVGGLEGFHLGDEAMLEANLDALRRWYPDIRFVASSRDPSFTAGRYSVRAIRPCSLSAIALPEPDWDSDADLRQRTGWLLDDATVEAVREADGLIVSGGGNLCATWPEKLLERAALLHCAADLGKPAIVVGQTLGPELTPRLSTLLGAALGRARMVGVRESASFDLGRSLGLQNLCMQVDDAFFLEPRPKGGEAARWLAAARRFILVALDPSLGSAANAQRLEKLAAQLDALASVIDADLVFVPHVGRTETADERTDDRWVGRRLSALLSTDLRQVDSWEPGEVRWLTGHAALVVSTRYHGVVFATAAGVPALGVHSDRYTRAKLRGALAHADLAGWAIDLDSAARGNLLTAGAELWHRREEVRYRLAALREKAVGLEQSRWERIGGALGLESRRVSVAALEARTRQPASGSGGTTAAARQTPRDLPGEEQWREYANRGYLHLGRVLDELELAALQQRIDAIMLGEVRLPCLATQLDTGGAYDEPPDPAAGLVKPSLAYRKVQGLEGDPLFLALIRSDVFREICHRHYGAHASASILRAMVVNKPAGRGTHVPWHQDGGDVWGLDRDPLMTIWVALDPATRETGCLQVIPGTHRLGLLSRDRSALSAESARSHCPEEAIVHLEIEAGEALLLHNWVVRRSGVNETSSRHRAFTACYMDGRTLSTLTGDRFPIVFGEHEDGEEALPFVGGLKDEVRLLRATAEEAVRYAESLSQEVQTLRARREETERYAWSLEAELQRIRKEKGASG
jgi:polysaccharide pyruvyl transferase WcaK-like protein